VRRELETVLRKFPNAILVRVNLENPGLAHEFARRGASLPLRAAPAIKQLRQRCDATRASFILWGKEGAVEILAPRSSTLGQLLRRAEASEGLTVSYASNTKALCWRAGNSEEISLEDAVPLGCFAEAKIPDGSELRSLASLDVDAKFLGESGGFGANALFSRRVEETYSMLEDMNALFSEPSYQEAVKACRDRRSVVKLAREVQFQVLPKYGIEATERGTAVMGHMTSLVQRLPDIGNRAAKSMDLSYIQHMHRLPATEKNSNTSPPPSAAEAPVAVPNTKPAQVNEAKAIHLKLIAGRPTEPDPTGDVFHIEVPAQCTIGELRKLLVSALAWDDATMRSAEFAANSGAENMGNSESLQDSDWVQTELMVHGAPLRKPRELVEVTFRQMPGEETEDDATLKLQVFSDCTVADLRSLLGEELQWDERTRKTVRFLFRLQGGSYGGLKDHEGVDARKPIFVLGTSLQARRPFDRPSKPAPDATKSAPVSAPKASPSPAPSPAPAPAAAVAHIVKAVAEARRDTRAAAAKEMDGTWVRYPHYDLAGRDAEQMEAIDMEAVKRRVELKAYAGFSLWMGKAYMKKADRGVSKSDLDFKGTGNAVVFYLFTPNGPSANAGLRLSKALALQAELMEAFSKPDFQRSLCELKRLHKGGKFQMERTKLCLTVQGRVLPKYGFDGSLGGVMEMLEAFGNPKLQTFSMMRNGELISELLEGVPEAAAPQVH